MMIEIRCGFLVNIYVIFKGKMVLYNKLKMFQVNKEIFILRNWYCKGMNYIIKDGNEE